MSRIGKKIIPVPSGVTVEVKDAEVKVKGPKGELELRLDPQVELTQKATDDGSVLELTARDAENDSAIWGTMRALVANMIIGVTEGWTKALELNGVGFKLALQGQKLKMSLGFSHEVEYELPKEVTGAVEGNILTLTSIDKQLVGKVAAEIRALKKPEPYKGKGFRYTDETIRRKVGKAAKTE